MALSRRLRFEILRRDAYTCRYCGASAPDVKLTVDHVVPTALGGGDDPSNLVTACAACNSGKSSATADAELVADVDATAMLFGRAMERVAAERRASFAALEEQIFNFDAEWELYRTTNGSDVPRDADWQESLERFFAYGLTFEEMHAYIAKGMRSAKRADGVWKYFCGCCWKEITTRQELARRMIEDGRV